MRIHILNDVLSFLQAATTKRKENQDKPMDKMAATLSAYLEQKSACLGSQSTAQSNVVQLEHNDMWAALERLVLLAELSAIDIIDLSVDLTVFIANFIKEQRK